MTLLGDAATPRPRGAGTAGHRPYTPDGQVRSDREIEAGQAPRAGRAVLSPRLADGPP